MGYAVLEDGPRRYIARRAVEEIRPGSIVNLGIGVPEGVARIARELNQLDDMVLTVESGPIEGFMNISQTARKVVFLGTFTSGGLEIRFADGKLQILS